MHISATPFNAKEEKRAEIFAGDAVCSIQLAKILFIYIGGKMWSNLALGRRSTKMGTKNGLGDWFQHKNIAVNTNACSLRIKLLI